MIFTCLHLKNYIIYIKLYAIQYHNANDTIIKVAFILSVSSSILIVFKYDNKNLEILIYMTNICIDCLKLLKNDQMSISRFFVWHGINLN